MRGVPTPPSTASPEQGFRLLGFLAALVSSLDSGAVALVGMELFFLHLLSFPSIFCCRE
jgi:hypothetical protein